MASSIPSGPSSPPLDRTMLRIYLNDHLAGSVAGLGRLRRTAESLRSTPVGADLAQVATEVEQERDELQGLMARLDLPQSRPKQVAVWLGEHVGRVKSNGRIVRSSTLTPLLELELLRSAVMGKRGLWQTLIDLGPELGLDPAIPALLVGLTDELLKRLDSAHAYVRGRALRQWPER